MTGLLFVITFLWGSTFIFSKVVLPHFSPAFILFVRFFVSALLFFILFGKQISLDKKVIRAGLFIGLANGAAMFLQLIGLQYTTATNSGFITSVYIVFVPILEYLGWKKKISRTIPVSILLSLGGIYLLSTGGALLHLNRGDILTLFCGAIFAFQIFLISHYGRFYDTFTLVFMQFVITFLMGLVTILFQGGIVRGTDYLRWDVMGALAVLTVLGTFIPFAMQFFIQKRISPTVAGIIYLSEPVFATLLAFLILGERLVPLQWGGIFLILAGILISIRR
jgi:drug/metabolite transporter (DMT)-like permease